MGNGFDFAEKNAVCTETRYSYSYNAVKGSCLGLGCTLGVAQASVTGYKDVSTDSKKTLMSTVAQQAVSIIEAWRRTPTENALEV